MSQPSLEQSLSALMDGQADELELQRILQHGQDSGLRDTWQRYHYARMAMHQELPLLNLDISAKVSQAIADEPAPNAAIAKPSRWLAWSQVAVAASVMLAVLAGVRFYNQPEITANQTIVASAGETLHLAKPEQQNPVVLAGYSGLAGREQAIAEQDESSKWMRQRLPVYLRQHMQQTGSASSENTLPYARAASMESR